jgi:saposin
MQDTTTQRQILSCFYSPPSSCTQDPTTQCQIRSCFYLPPFSCTQDPTTQRQILDYAKQGCEVFQDFKQQCETYVDVYGPLVLNMALQYLQPMPLCTRMGYCQAVPHAA